MLVELGCLMSVFVSVEQAVVYSTSTTGLSTLTFRGGVVVNGGGVEERSEVMYWHRGAYIIYYKEHNVSQLYSVTDGGLGPRVYDYIIIRNTARMTKIGVSRTSGR